jgi:hypothetical protein
MTWADLIIILVATSLGMVMKHLDTMPGYSCPEYCGVRHDHFLDLQSDSDQRVGKKAKSKKIRVLAVK